MARRADEIRDRRIGYALDASAVLALLRDEPGSDWVAGVLDVSILSTVNWAEVLGKAREHGADLHDGARRLEALGVVILPFTRDDAALVAELRLETRDRGLSLGDRACLALARRFGATALTADRGWLGLDVGVEVQLIRHGA